MTADAPKELSIGWRDGPASQSAQVYHLPAESVEPNAKH